jgi:hypothetical protein
VKGRSLICVFLLRDGLAHILQDICHSRKLIGHRRAQVCQTAKGVFAHQMLTVSCVDTGSEPFQARAAAGKPPAYLPRFDAPLFAQLRRDGVQAVHRIGKVFLPALQPQPATAANFITALAVHTADARRTERCHLL